MRTALLTLVLVGAVGCGDSNKPAPASRGSDRPASTYKDADNTDRNVRDKDGLAPTPTDQGGSETDLRRTADIRKRIMDAKLSVDGQNVKIVTTGGRVTLRGPVSSQSEKDSIVRMAVEVAGESNVVDELEVKTGR